MVLVVVDLYLRCAAASLGLSHRRHHFLNGNYENFFCRRAVITINTFRVNLHVGRTCPHAGTRSNFDIGTKLPAPCDT